MPRFDSCSSHCFGFSALSRSSAAQHSVAGNRNSGMVKFLFQITDDGPRTLSRARSVHSVDEAEEHVATFKRRRADHAPGVGILRLRLCGAMLCGGRPRPRAFELNHGRWPESITQFSSLFDTRQTSPKTDQCLSSEDNMASTAAASTALRHGCESCMSSTTNSPDPYAVSEEHSQSQWHSAGLDRVKSRTPRHASSFLQECSQPAGGAVSRCAPCRSC